MGERNIKKIEREFLLIWDWHWQQCDGSVFQRGSYCLPFAYLEMKKKMFIKKK